MSATYDPTLPTDRDHVRLLIRDTDTADATFQDEEIDATLDAESVTTPANRYYAAARLIEALATKMATARGPGNVRDRTIGKLRAIWGVDRDTLEALNHRIRELKMRGAYLAATSSKHFRAIRAGDRTVD